MSPLLLMIGYKHIERSVLNVSNEFQIRFNLIHSGILKRNLCAKIRTALHHNRSRSREEEEREKEAKKICSLNGVYEEKT